MANHVFPILETSFCKHFHIFYIRQISIMFKINNFIYIYCTNRIWSYHLNK